MSQETILQGVLLDDTRLSLEELASACGVQVQWLQLRVQAQLIGTAAADTTSFDSRDLLRARRIAQAEAMFDINQEAAALIADLIEEVQQLKARLAHFQAQASSPD